ncbi:MAG: hypothetical protein QF663_00650 [Verrucomicrobiota bacterium]|jgi:hypothetical protein|nr:hypothetical protein [Verrucomicrobiota bacterium]|tara:strand:+ start:1671 stop:2081 length:411 start_codon:yes stop_codon:yes gene_type:complete
MRWFCFIGACFFLLAGCTTSTITNLTPRELPWSQTGLYPVEAMFRSNQRTLDSASIKPMVIFNNQAFPMRQTQLTQGRWETLVLIPDGTRVINYHFKFDYDYSAVLMRGADSKLSPPYQLQIVDESSTGNLLMLRE